MFYYEHPNCDGFEQNLFDEAVDLKCQYTNGTMYNISNLWPTAVYLISKHN